MEIVMTGVIINVVLVALGSIIGILFKKGIPQKLSEVIMQGLALCVLYIGISGTLQCKNTLILIISVVIGAIIGQLIDIDKRLNYLGEILQNKFSKDGSNNFVSGFVSASLLFCVGAMAVVGSLQAGLKGDNEILFSKSVIDAVAAVILASAYGFGVIFSVFSIFIYQGLIAMLAQYISPFLNEYTIAEMTGVGSVLIIAIAFNMLKITKINVANLLPAVIIPIFLCLFM